MINYLVVWKLEIEARDPKEAATIALEAIKSRPRFSVFTEMGEECLIDPTEERDMMVA